MKLLIPEIFAHKIRIVGIETIDKKTGEFDAYTWESFDRQYINDWVVKAIEVIEAKKGSPRCFLYLNDIKSEK